VRSILLHHLLTLSFFAEIFPVTTSKTATKAANAKPTKAKKGEHLPVLDIRSLTAAFTVKADTADKPKRAPTAYNLFVKANMPTWLAENQGKTHKDAMSAVSHVLLIL
jgi:hypothetical protein